MSDETPELYRKPFIIEAHDPSAVLFGDINSILGFFQDYFDSSKFLYRPNMHNIDFIVMDKTGRHVLWAETKRSA